MAAGICPVLYLFSLRSVTDRIGGTDEGMTLLSGRTRRYGWRADPSRVHRFQGLQAPPRPTSSGLPPRRDAPAQGGVLNLYGIDPTTLDPAVTAEAGSTEFILQIFGGLVRLDNRMEPVPDIAERWEVSADGKTYTFHLRQNARFHNGRAVTASDFKYSWERAANPATGSSTAGTYLGDIVGVKEMLAGKARDLSGVRVIGDNTLQVTIAAPKTYFPYKLTYPVAFVVDQAEVKGGGEWWRDPNGTGPFKFKEWTKSSQLVLERNSQYHGKVANLSSVVFHMLAGLPMSLYETGQIDVAGVALPYIDAASDPAGPFLPELVIVPELSFFYIGFDATGPRLTMPTCAVPFPWRSTRTNWWTSYSVAP